MTDWLIVDWLTGGPVDVTVGFWVLSIDTINVIDMVSNETYKSREGAISHGSFQSVWRHDKSSLD